MACTLWPETNTFGCTDVNETRWQLLYSIMDTSMTKSCEILCRLRGEDGCCYLHDGSSGKHRGCWWKAGTEAYKGANSSATGIAITCSEIGIFIKALEFLTIYELLVDNYIL